MKREVPTICVNFMVVVLISYLDGWAIERTLDSHKGDTENSMFSVLSCRWRCLLLDGQLLLLFFSRRAASTNEGPCASFSNSARMPLIFLMGIYVKKKIYEPQRTRRRRKNKDLAAAAAASARSCTVIEMCYGWRSLFIYCRYK